MLNRQVGTHEPYTFTEHEVDDMAKRSGLTPKAVKESKAPGKLLCVHWGNRAMQGYILEWTGKEWREA